MASTAETLAQWACDYVPVCEDVVVARRALLDVVAVALAARGDPIVDVVASLPDAARWAAVGHVLDFDDLHLSSTAHISVVCVAATLAAGGDDRAYLAGAGVMARLGVALGWPHYAAGWHVTCTAGAPAAAVAAGVAWGLPAERIAAAIALAVPAAGGVQRAFGSAAKAVQVGFAADAGVRAAELAAAGATADPRALDDWLRLVGGDPARVDLSGPAVPGGLAMKLFPCCYALQRPIAVLREQLPPGVDADRVIEVRVVTPQAALQPLIHHRPRTGLQGKFSLEYAIAATLLDGWPGFASFTDAAVARSSARRLVEAVHVDPLPDGDGLLSGECEITVRLCDGVEYHVTGRWPPGSPQRPPSSDDIAGKVADCGVDVPGLLADLDWSTASAILAEQFPERPARRSWATVSAGPASSSRGPGGVAAVIPPPGPVAGTADRSPGAMRGSMPGPAAAASDPHARPASPAASRPLAGVTVVSVEQAVAAPFATRHLADLGARVIKVERPDRGDFARYYDETVRGQSSYFVWLNRSKQSLTLDVASEAGRMILWDLLARADVFVQNLAPGAARRLGVDAATLTAYHPGLIVCSISGYGCDGPWAGRKAYDLLVQCETGLVSLTGGPDEPAKVGVSVADIAAGVYAYAGVLAALHRRATSGAVSPVEVSLFDALGEWLGAPAGYTRYGGQQPPRTGLRHATIAPYGPVRTGDGQTIVVAVQNDREWRSLCRVVLDDPELAVDERFATNPARVTHRAALEEVIAARFRELDTAAAVGLLDAAGVAYARLNSLDGFLEHPVLAGRGRWRVVDTPGGPVEALLPPVGLGGVEPVMGPVPALGEHTDVILHELGRTREEIDALRAAGVI